MKNKHLLLRALAAVFLLLILIALVLTALALWYSKEPDKAARARLPEAVSELESGDLVLRMGTVTDSYVIACVSHSDYSHLGMIVKTSPEILVAHATTSDHEGTPDQAQLSPLGDFWAPRLAARALALRLNFLSTAQKEAIAARLIAEQGTPFVLAPKSEPHFYCSTMVADAIKAVKPDFKLRWQELDYPGFKGLYLFPQSFLELRDTQVLMSFIPEGAH